MKEPVETSNDIYISGLHFQPWVGKGYAVGKGILLLGESHYIDRSCDDDDLSVGYDLWTRVVVGDEYLAGKIQETKFFDRIGRLFNPDDQYQIWQQIAFANLIQIGFPEKRCQPGPREIATIDPAFRLLLNGLKPGKVIVLSKRMWTYWINRGEFVSPFSESGKNTQLRKYYFDDQGRSCLAIGIAHPSWMWGRTAHANWRSVVQKFLSI